MPRDVRVSQQKVLEELKKGQIPVVTDRSRSVEEAEWELSLERKLDLSLGDGRHF